jgi:hypothetical protein
MSCGADQIGRPRNSLYETPEGAAVRGLVVLDGEIIGENEMEDLRPPIAGVS